MSPINNRTAQSPASRAGTRNAWRRALVVALSAFTFMGCLSAPDEIADTQPRLRMNISLERPASSSMQLKTLHVVLRSNRGDIVTDTITDQGGTLSGAHVVLNPPAHQGQILTPRYDLPAAEEWTASLQSFDARDSVVHREEHTLGALGRGEIRDLPLRLQARIAAYEGLIGALPAAYEGRRIVLHRIELAIDGQTYEATAPAAEAGQPLRVLYEYLPAGRHDVHTRLYGTLGEDPSPRLLWEGREHLDIRADTRSTVTVPLNWALPATTLGKTAATSDDMNARILLGRVGHVVMNVTIPSAIVL